MADQLPLIGGGRDATISGDGWYRYTLRRVWGDGDPATWMMLNPSTADAVEDDPTIRRCVGFAQEWGCGGITVVNLYAFRATDPRALWAADDPVGPDNDDTIREVLAVADGPIVFAWGGHARSERVADVEAIAADVGGLCRVGCLGRTVGGAPRHPLYLPRTTRLRPWAETSS